MHSFKNILVNLDYPYDDTRPLSQALEIAVASGGTLKVIDVVQKIPAAIQAMGLQDTYISNRRMALLSAIGKHQSAEKVVKVVVDEGPAAQRIVEEVVSHNHDLVLRMTQHTNPLQAALLGTTSLRLMRKCPCPVWILQPNEPVGRRRVAAAVDVSSASSEELALNRKILSFAGSLATFTDSELQVVYSDGASKKDIELVPDVPADQWDQLIADTRRDARANLQSLTGTELPELPAGNVHILSGSADECIPKFLTTSRIDTLVMGSVARTGIAGFLMGNTAERILRQVRCSVMTIKPDDFACVVPRLQ